MTGDVTSRQIVPKWESVPTPEYAAIVGAPAKPHGFF